MRRWPPSAAAVCSTGLTLPVTPPCPTLRRTAT
jgi:hypothetical protein